MTGQNPEQAGTPPERETWFRNLRGYKETPGLWHLVKRRAERSYGWSNAADCGFHPDYRAQRCDDRPTKGKFCPKCLRAAEQRLRPGMTQSGDAS
jgi:hypothetical protein